MTTYISLDFIISEIERFRVATRGKETGMSYGHALCNALRTIAAADPHDFKDGEVIVFEKISGNEGNGDKKGVYRLYPVPNEPQVRRMSVVNPTEDSRYC